MQVLPYKGFSFASKVFILLSKQLIVGACGMNLLVEVEDIGFFMLELLSKQQNFCI
jgi:hypothetical protein